MRTLRVLQYHRIADASDSAFKSGSALAGSVFEKHLDWLDRLGFTTITFDDLRLCQAGELTLPRKPIIITFDGGHLDTYEHAFPLLQDRGMKAVFFVLGDRSVRFAQQERGGPSSALPLINDQQVVELHEAGCEIGSLSLTNEKLTSLDAHTAWEEILRSRMNLEIVLNAPVRSFAYPHGQVNEAVRAMVVQAQYSYACIAESASLWPSRDLYGIRRFQVNRSQRFTDFAFRIHGIWPLRPWAMSLERELHPANHQGGEL